MLQRRWTLRLDSVEPQEFWDRVLVDDVSDDIEERTHGDGEHVRLVAGERETADVVVADQDEVGHDAHGDTLIVSRDDHRGIEVPSSLGVQELDLEQPVALGIEHGR